MGYRELYTAANMADEEYNISDKGLSITPDKINFTVAPGAVAEGQFVVAGAQGTAVTGFLTSDNFRMQLRRDSFAENPDRISWRFDAGTLTDGDVCEGTIGIVSNCGEYRIPFKAEAVTPQVAGRELQGGLGERCETLLQKGFRAVAGHGRRENAVQRALAVSRQ